VTRPGAPERGQSAEYREDRIALPEMWYSVSAVVVRGTTLYYRLGDPRPLRQTDGRYRRDGRGRVALEAFLGLSTDAMFDRLETTKASRIERNVEPRHELYGEVFRELISFVETFGPFGLDWSRLHLVLNPDADRLAEENWRLTLAAAGFKADAPQPSVGTPVWRAVFPEPGQPFFPYIEKAVTYPDLPWEERVRLGDPRIHHDDIGMRDAGPLARARGALMAAVRLADALSRKNRFELRDAIADFPRAAVFDVRDHPSESSLEFDWRAANLGMQPRDGWFKPFDVHEAQVDWAALGNMVLAEWISLRLASTSVGVGLRDGRPTFGWRINSLFEVIYLQLFDHVRQHPDFGIGTCALCKAPILRVRHEQRWHTGCAPVGRQRESRAARKRQAVEDDHESGLG
jgi:hypothetical protein